MKASLLLATKLLAVSCFYSQQASAAPSGVELDTDLFEQLIAGKE
jgi:hypothetical protein